jgi:hypothetical protein
LRRAVPRDSYFRISKTEDIQKFFCDGKVTLFSDIKNQKNAGNGVTFLFLDNGEEKHVRHSGIYGQ